jgi:prepilin-type N-terminal cleavage/methylation domain-containing protein
VPGAALQSDPVPHASRAAAPRGRIGAARRDGFTLVELIFVLVLLLIVASLVAPRMSSFFRGRALSQEARRMLSVMQYAQSRAVSEGVPIVLWFDPARGVYGLEAEGGHSGMDERFVDYVLEPTLQLELPTVTDAPVSEEGDEAFGFRDRAGIRFNPDGFFDDVSVSRVIIRQGSEGALQLAPAPDRLGYEILPVAHAN